MGLFDKLFGGTKQKTRPAPLAEVSGGLILEQFFPGISQTGSKGLGEKTIGKLTKAGVPVSSVLPDILDYETIFEKQTAGTLTPFETTVLDTVLKTIGTPVSVTLPQGGGVPGAVGQAPKFTPPPNIGVLTSQIMKSLPPPMQTFISNVFEDSSPEAIDRELENFSQAMLAEASRNAESLGGQILNRLASEGFGTSGTVIQALKQIAVESAISVNAEIARARLGMLDTLIRARDIGVNLVNVLGSLGATEHANLVRGKIAEIDAQAGIIQAQIAAQAEVQQALIAANADIQRAQMGLLSDVMRTVVGERAAEEQFKLAPYEILTRLATGVSPVSTMRQTQGVIPALFSRQGALGGVADLVGSLMSK